MDKNNILAAEHKASAIRAYDLNDTLKGFLGKKIPKKLIKQVQKEIKASFDVLRLEHPKVVFNPRAMNGPAAVCVKGLKEVIEENLNDLKKEIAAGDFFAVSNYLWDLGEDHSIMATHLKHTPWYGRNGKEYRKTWVTQVLKRNKRYNSKISKISHQLEDFQEVREEYWILWTKYKNALE